MFMFATALQSLQKDHEERQIALEYLVDAWQSAEQDGVESEALAHAALFAAFATLVDHFGEEVTADLIAELPERIRRGEYSLNRTVQ